MQVVTMVPGRGGLFWIAVPLTIPGDVDLGPEGKRIDGAPGSREKVQSSQRERHI